MAAGAQLNPVVGTAIGALEFSVQEMQRTKETHLELHARY